MSPARGGRGRVTAGRSVTGRPRRGAHKLSPRRSSARARRPRRSRTPGRTRSGSGCSRSGARRRRAPSSRWTPLRTDSRRPTGSTGSCSAPSSETARSALRASGATWARRGSATSTRLWIMSWRRARYLASGVLIAVALLSGATVGSAVLLGSAEQRGDPVGRLSAHLEAGSAAVPAARGSRAVDLPESTRGSQAPAVSVVNAASPRPPPPSVQSPPPAPIPPAAATTATRPPARYARRAPESRTVRTTASRVSRAGTTRRSPTTERVA